MKPFHIVVLLALCVPACAQVPAPPHFIPSGLGFSYALPSDWEIVNSQSSLPQLKQQASQNATTEAEKKGLECVQLLLTARHGNPASMIVELALPLDCFGEPMSEKDLPGFAAGASQGIRQSLNLRTPEHSSYSVAGHPFWIERVKGTPAGQSYLPPYTIEVSCGLLQKAAVCWMTMAAEDADLQSFEHGSLALDGQLPVPLVPATAFDAKPM